MLFLFRCSLLVPRQTNSYLVCSGKPFFLFPRQTPFFGGRFINLPLAGFKPRTFPGWAGGGSAALGTSPIYSPLPHIFTKKTFQEGFCAIQYVESSILKFLQGSFRLSSVHRPRSPFPNVYLDILALCISSVPEPSPPRNFTLSVSSAW